jgi:hypothetical protein
MLREKVRSMIDIVACACAAVRLVVWVSGFRPERPEPEPASIRSRAWSPMELASRGVTSMRSRAAGATMTGSSRARLAGGGWLGAL